jgi:hypothetical protein
MNTIHLSCIGIVTRDLPRQVKDRRNILDGVSNILAVRHRAFSSLDARVRHPRRHPRRHDTQVLLSRIQHLPNDVRAQKSGPARDQDLLFSFC